MEDKDFYNIHAGTKGRSQGVYLDEVERENAELNRAKIEGREPDFDNAPAVAGTPLVTKPQLVDNSLMSNGDRQGVEDEAKPMSNLTVDTSKDEDPKVDTAFVDMLDNDSAHRKPLSQVSDEHKPAVDEVATAVDLKREETEKDGKTDQNINDVLGEKSNSSSTPSFGGTGL